MDRGGVLALDLSSRCGWAYGTLDAPQPLSGVWVLPAMSSVGGTGVALLDRLDDIMKGMGPSLIVCEAPLPPQAQTAMNTARLQFGLAFAVDMFGHWNDVEVLEEKADLVRQTMMGRSRFPKGQTKVAVMEWVRAKGCTPPDHNSADATLLWFHARAIVVRRKQGKLS